MQIVVRQTHGLSQTAEVIRKTLFTLFCDYICKGADLHMQTHTLPTNNGNKTSSLARSRGSLSRAPSSFGYVSSRYLLSDDSDFLARWNWAINSVDTISFPGL
jgi:hypothetical protein